MIRIQRILFIALVSTVTCSLSLDNEAIRTRVNTAEARVADLRRTIANIPMADIPGIIQELDRLTSSVSPLKDQPTKLAKSLKQDVQSSLARVDAVVAAARLLEGDLSQRQQRDNDKLAADIFRVNDQLQRVRAENAALQQQLTAAQAERNALELQAGNLAAEIRVAQELAHKSAASEKADKSEIGALTRTLEQSQTQVAQLQVNLANAQKTLAASAAASAQGVDAAQQEVLRLQGELAVLQQNFQRTDAALQKAVAAQEKALGEKQAAELVATKAQHDLQIARQEAQRLGTQLVADKAAFDAQLAQASAAVAAVPHDAQLQARFDALAIEKEKLATDLVSLQQESRDNQARHAQDARQLEGANATLAARISQLEQRNKELEASAQKLSADAQAAQASASSAASGTPFLAKSTGGEAGKGAAAVPVDQSLLQPDMQFGIDLNILKSLYAHWQVAKENQEPDVLSAKKLYEFYLSKSNDQAQANKSIESFFRTKSMAIKPYDAVFRRNSWTQEKLVDYLKTPEQRQLEAAQAAARVTVDKGVANRRLSLLGMTSFDSYLNDPSSLWAIDDPDDAFEILKPLLLDAALKAGRQDAIRRLNAIEKDDFDEEKYGQELAQIVTLIKSRK